METILNHLFYVPVAMVAGAFLWRYKENVLDVAKQVAKRLRLIKDDKL